MTFTHKKPAHKLKTYSAEEIDLLLRGDRREIDKLILLALNGIAEVVIPHAEREEEIINRIEQLGGLDAISKRSLWIEEQIAKAKMQNAFWAKMRDKAGELTVAAFLACLFAVLVYYWNGHMPTSAQITTMGLTAK